MSSSAPLPLWPIFRGETYDPSDEENIDDGVDSEFDSDSDSDSDCDFDCDSDEEIDRIEKQIDRRNRLFKVDEDGDLVWHLNFSAYTRKSGNVAVASPQEQHTIRAPLPSSNSTSRIVC